jgi:signal transduction histidine kinase
MRSQVEVAGTSLAQEARVPAVSVKSTSPDAVWRDHRNQFFLEEAGKTTRVMIGLGCFVQIAVLSVFFHADYPTWRIGALAGFYVAFAVVHKLMTMRPGRDAQRVESAFIQMSVFAQLFMVGSAAVTGGVHSPFLPSVVMPSIISLLFFGPYPVARWTAVGNGLLAFAMVCLPQATVGPSLPASHYTIAVMLGLGWNLFMLHLLVGKLTAMSNRAGDSMACLREERVSEAVAQLRRLQSVGAKVAHELKNPLASIKGLCQLVARTPESERTQERLAVVASEISRMETILNEYLSFSRPLEDLVPQSLDLAAVAQDVLDVLAGRADQAGVSLEIEGGPTTVKGDPRRLKEALINLVSNAIEATPTGGHVVLRVRTTASGVTLEVKDSGRGISSEDLERLGTSFFTTRPNGTGLGVVLAQSVITQHGGSLDYTSTIGQGTTATIVLPTQSTAAPEPAARAAMVEARA